MKEYKLVEGEGKGNKIYTVSILPGQVDKVYGELLEKCKAPNSNVSGMSMADVRLRGVRNCKTNPDLLENYHHTISLYAQKGDAYKLSGRCSVFCKSDCTHALNKGEKLEDITAGLCEMLAEKIFELLCGKKMENVLFIGGLSLNNVIADILKKRYKGLEVIKESSYFEALGASVQALQNGKKLEKRIFNEDISQIDFYRPLREYENMVEFKSMNKREAEEGEDCIIGLDVGSTTTKAVLIGEKDNGLLGSVYLRTNGNPVEASRNCYRRIKENIRGKTVNINGIGVTGSGRQVAGLYSMTDGIINEIIAHATASSFFDKEVDTIFEIGGQDAKYTYLINSVPSDYAMNEACSAGTGSFLEEAALESLKVNVEDIAERAIRADSPPNFSDQCAAFISSDIKNAAQEGVDNDAILAGLVYSICLNYVNRVKGNRPVGKKIFMQGGVCYNKAVPLAMAALMNKNIVVPPEPGLMGAFGVALEVKNKLSENNLQKRVIIIV